MSKSEPNTGAHEHHHHGHAGDPHHGHNHQHESHRIIPCLDIKDGRVVKGIQFGSLRDAGDPVEQARKYEEQGADELAFLDISATLEGRQTLIPLLRKIRAQVQLPILVGGGVRSVDDAGAILEAGASKVLVSSAALANPGLINELSARFGSQAVVVGIDAKAEEGRFEVWSHGASKATGIEAVAWAQEVVERGAGEILLTSIDRDGMKSGFNLALTHAVASAVPAPVIASGGAGKVEDFSEVFIKGQAEAALAASLFHFGELSVQQVKEHCAGLGIPMRLGSDESASTPSSGPNSKRDSDSAPPNPQRLSPADLDFSKNEDGLIPAVVQDFRSGEVLMLAFQNREALEETLKTGDATFWSRSRQELWRKGAESGNVQRVLSASTDCDRDAVVLQVSPAGPAYHTGERSCFFRPLEGGAGSEGQDGDDSKSVGPEALASLKVLLKLEETLESRRSDPPEGSYVAKLYADESKRHKKVGEEATELVVASLQGRRPEIVSEAADLLFHTLVLLRSNEVSLAEVAKELEKRIGAPRRE